MQTARQSATKMTRDAHAGEGEPEGETAARATSGVVAMARKLTVGAGEGHGQGEMRCFSGSWMVESQIG